MASLKSQSRNQVAIIGNVAAKNVHNDMSNKTKCFIQKICDKRTASIDMTKYGFVKYASAMHPLGLLLKPLKDQLNKIFGPKKSASTKSTCRFSRTANILNENTKSKSSYKTKQVHHRRKVRIESAHRSIDRERSKRQPKPPKK